MGIMYIFFFSFFLVFFLCLVIFFFSNYFMEGELYKSGPFECGFSFFSSFSYPFSIPFFLISLLFLLFDVEILLVCLFPLSCNFLSSMMNVTFFVIFLIFFLTIYEWAKGIFSWL